MAERWTYDPYPDDGPLWEEVYTYGFDLPRWHAERAALESIGRDRHIADYD